MVSDLGHLPRFLLRPASADQRGHAVYITVTIAMIVTIVAAMIIITIMAAYSICNENEKYI